MTAPLLSGPHDRGGMPSDGPIDLSEHQHQDWELIVESISAFLGASGLRTVHEARRAQESIPISVYESLSYYERWAVATEMALTERGILSTQEIDERASEVRARWCRD